MKKLPTDKTELLNYAHKMGVSLHRLYNSEGILDVPELHNRIINYQRSIREGRLWLIALISAIASLLSALASWTAVLRTLA